MVFCHEWLQVGDGQICAIPMSDDLGEAIGDPVILFRASDGKWNAKGGKEGGYVTCLLYTSHHTPSALYCRHHLPR